MMLPKKEALPVNIRVAAIEDIPFIFNSWLKSYRETGMICAGVSNTIYFESHHRILQKIAKRAQIFVACDAVYPDQIIGYIAAEHVDGVFVIHYIYVKHNFRKKGVGKLLLNSFNHDLSYGSCCTHLTKVADRLIAKFNIIYHPYVVLVDYEVPTEEAASENT